MVEISKWKVGQRVEARHPAYHREWGMGTVQGQYDAYVKVHFDDGLRSPWDNSYMSSEPIQVYHLNVRVPGTPDPVSLLRTPEEIVQAQAQELGGGWRMEHGVMPVVILTTVEAARIIEKLKSLEQWERGDSA